MIALRKRTLLFLLLFPVFVLPACSQKNGEENGLRPPRGYPNETLLKAAYALGMIKLIDKNPAVPADLQQYRGIVYKKIDTTALRLDIYEKKNTDTIQPALIFIHGGGWSKGKREDYLPYLIRFAEQGYVTVTVSYRLLKTAPFPAAVEDVKCAVRWVRAHGKRYHIDTARIALIGGSAGGHLALMAGYTGDDTFRGPCPDSVPARVSVVVDLYGPVDLTTPYARERHEVTGFLRKSWEEDPDLYREASPRYHISPDDPPTLIFQGTIDNLVPVSQSDSLHIWLNRAGVPNEYHRLKGWPHTMDASRKVFEYCFRTMEDFFREYL